MGKAANSMTREAYRQMQGYKDPQKQVLGARNRSRGKAFEDLVEAGCDYYRELGRADITKTPEPMKVLKRLEGGRFICCFEKKAQPDYSGPVRGKGMVYFEAKHTDTGRMEQNRVTLEQEQHFNRKHALGAGCFVVIGFGMADFFRIPWTVWREMKSVYGRKSLRTEDLSRYRITIGGSGVLLFLD